MRGEAWICANQDKIIKIDPMEVVTNLKMMRELMSEKKSFLVYQ